MSGYALRSCCVPPLDYLSMIRLRYQFWAMSRFDDLSCFRRRVEEYIVSLDVPTHAKESNFGKNGAPR